MKHLKISPDDPRLTAYALGELQGDERAAVEVALAHDAEARAFVEETRTFAAQMEAALGDEPEVDLVPRMDVSGGEDDVHPPAPPLAQPAPLPPYERTGSKFLRFPQLYFVVGGLAAAGFALMVALHQEPPGYTTKYTEIDLRDRAAAKQAAETLAQAPAAGLAREHAQAQSAAAEAQPVLARSEDASRRLPSVNRGLIDAGTSRALADNSWGASTMNFVEARKPAPTFSVPAQLQAPDLTLSADHGRGGKNGTGSVAGQGTLSTPAVTGALAAAGNPGTPNAGNERKFATEVVVANDQPTEIVTLSPFEVSASPVSGYAAANTLAGSRVGPPALAVPSGADIGVKLPTGPAPVEGKLAKRTEAKPPARPYAGSFVSAPATPVADFWIPIDTGSFAAIRGAIDIGKLPAPDLVKIEELLNREIDAVKPSAASRMNLATGTAANGQLITTVIEAGEAPWAPTHRLVRIGLKAAPGDRTGIDAAAGRKNHIVARDIKVEVEFNPRRVSMYRLIGYERPSAATSKAVSSAWTAGTIEAGRVVTALFEIVPASPENDADDSAGLGTYGPVGHLVTEEKARAAAQMLTLRVHYRNADSNARGKLAVAFIDSGTTFSGTSDDFKFAAGVAAYGMILRDSPNRGKATLDNAIAWATAGVSKPGDDVGGQRGQIIDLMRRTRALLR